MDHMETTTLDNVTLGQLAVKDFRKAIVFKKYGLDFCCGGKKTVREACAEKGLDYAQVEQELTQANNYADRSALRFDEWGLDFLADYIVTVHHSYVKKTLPEIRTYAAKVATKHGERYPYMVEVYKLVDAVDREMNEHMMKEEAVLFPIVKNMVAGACPVAAPGRPLFSVNAPISKMEQEHEFVGRSLEKIRSLTNNYEVPPTACATHTVLLNMLADFENDLHMHVHLENNILFPKAIALEQSRRA